MRFCHERRQWSIWKTVLGVLSVVVLLGVSVGGGAQPAAPAATATPAKMTAPAATAVAPKPAAPAATAAPAAPTAAPKPAALTPITLVSTGESITYVVNALLRAGLDKKHGLEIKLVVMNPADGQAALLAGKADVATIPPLTMAQARIDGHDVVVFGPGMYMHASIVVPMDSPAKGLEDLKGKKIGTLGSPTATYRTSQMIAKDMGMDWEKDFQLVIGGSLPVLHGFLNQKQVDAISTAGFYTIKSVVNKESKEILFLNDFWQKRYGTKAVATTIASTGTWFNKNREAAKQLSQAYIEAGAIASTADEVRAQAKFLALETEAELVETAKRFPSYFGVKWDQPQVDDLYRMSKVAAELGAITAPPKDGTYVIP